MKKRFFLFWALILLNAICAHALHFVEDGIYYNTISGTQEVEVTLGVYSGEYGEYSGTIVIPSTVTHSGITYSVTGIEVSAFHNCIGLNEISIPVSVTNIGHSAFYGCSGLSSILIPDNVIKIGYRAFQNTAWYDNQPNGTVYAGKVLYAYKGTMPGNTEIDVLPGTLGITEMAFSECANLTRLTIPESVVHIGRDAFYRCVNLENVNYNAVNATSIYYRNSYIDAPLFDNCPSLSTINIGENVEVISPNAFKSCTGLLSITIPEKVTSIGSAAFSGCTALETVNYNAIHATAPSSYYDDSDRIFGNCTSISTVTFGENVEVIPSDIFRNCTELLSITIPEKVTSIGSAAFSGCTALETVNYNAIHATAPSYYYSYLIFGNCTSISTVTFGENVEVIPSDIFRNCTELLSITIPEKVTSIGSSAFSGCTALSTVNYNAIHATTPSYYDDSYLIFGNCTSLYTVTFGENVETIPDYIFYNCSGLTGTLTIPNSVTSIGYHAFYGCNINTVNYDAIDASGDGWAFVGCSLLSTVNIGENVETIPYGIFAGCTALSSLTIPEGITSIGNSAFSGCTGLTGTLTIPSTVTSIGYHAFYGCTGLTGTLTIPSTVTSIGYHAFYGCNINTVNYDAIDASGDGSVFEYCSLLSTVNIGENVKTIPDGIFAGCTALSSLTIAESVTTIGNSTFYGCSGLTEVTLPESVTSVREYAFYNCSNLSSMTVMRDTPPLCASNTFDGVNVSTCVLHVPAGSKSLYENARGWRDFTHTSDDIGVTKQGQTINFPSFTGKTYGDATVTLPATTNSGLTIHYESSNPQVATVSGNILTIVRAGTTNITASQAGNGSYLPAEPVTRTLTVNKATLTITADNKTRPYGEANPSFTLSYTGFKHNETAGVLQQLPAINCTAGVNSPVGSYTITLSGGYDTNYDYQFVTGRLDIIKAGQSISFGALSSQTYGNSDLVLPLTTNKGLTIRYDSSNPQVATVSGNILTIVGTGTCNITASQAGNENYLPAEPVVQTLFVNPKNVAHADVVVGSITGQVYKGSAILPELTIIYTSRLLAKNVDYVCSYSNNVNAGTATITIYGIGNYVGNKTVSFEILKASQSINFPELTNLTIGEEYPLLATATSGLPVRYVVNDQSVAQVIQKGNSTVLAILDEGQTFVTALQDGNTNYHAAEPVGQAIRVVSSTSLMQPEEQGIQVYPTLVKTGESVYIKTPANAILWIYTMSGALVNNISITEGVTPVMIPYVPGIYLFRITDAEKRQTVVKVIVK